MRHLNMFLVEHPELSLVLSATPQEQEVLIWANEGKYISLKKAPTGELCFTEWDLREAKLWKEKLEDVTE